MTFMDKNFIKREFLGILPRNMSLCSDCAKIMQGKDEIIMEHEFPILMFICIGSF